MIKVGGRAHGIALVTTATILWSTAGLFVRMLDLDVWTLLAWRSLFGALSLAAIVAAQHGRHSLRAVRGIGWPGVAAIPLSAASMFCYVAALTLTSVANVLTVYATVPFMAAGLAFVWMREKAGRRVLLASAAALLGIVVMAGSSPEPRDVAGNALAFLMTLTFSAVLVVARRYPTIGMAPVNALAAALCGAACWPFATSVPDPGQLAILAAFGVITSGLAYLLFLTGGRYIPSGEAGLIGLLDVVLGPLWVWLAFSETPSRAAVLGAGIVLAAVVWYLAGLRRARPEAAETSV